jgi:hypothetical protein
VGKKREDFALRRFASLTGVSLIAGGAVALLLFANSARAQTNNLPVLGRSGLVTQQVGSGSGETTTTVPGSGSGATTTTVPGSGSGATTTTAAGATTTTAAAGATTTTLASGATTTTLAGGTTTTTAFTPSATQTTTCPGSPQISVTLQSVAPGGSTSVTGTCFRRNLDGQLILTSDPVSLGTFRTDGNGNFFVTVAIPRNTAVGNHTLTARAGDQSAAITLIVSNVSGFGVTGMSWNLLILGLALVAAGIVVLAGDRIGKQELIEFA